MRRSKTLAAMALVLASVGVQSAPTIVSVAGTSNPWLAGMPAGTDAGSGDSAPGQSPVLVSGVSLTAGGLLRFSAVGSTDHCGGASCGLAGPDGDPLDSVTSHGAGAQFGLSNIVSPIDALIGVFLTDAAPDGSAAPATLDFSTPASRDFSSLSPALKQVFFIGDGLRLDGSTAQDFVVPAGATRLFLGTMDGFGWFNNVGTLRVTVDDGTGTVPEPGTLALLGLAACGAGWARRRRA